MWITLALSMTYMLQFDGPTLLRDPPTRARLELIQAAQERNAELWELNTRERSKSIFTQLMLVYSEPWVRAWINFFPAEYLLWSDVLHPLRKRKYMPNFVTGFEPAKNFPIHVFIHLQYSQEDYHSPPESMQSGPRGIDQLSESIFPYLMMNLPSNCDLVWVTSQPPDLNMTRACIVIERVVSNQSTEKLGYLRSVETTVLVKECEQKGYFWRRQDSTWRVSRVRPYLRIHGAEVPKGLE